VEAHVEVVGFVAGETRAVDAGLLAGAQTNEHTAGSEGDGVGLRVFQRYGGEGEIAAGRVGEACGFAGEDGGEGCVGGDQGVVAALFEGHAVDGAGFAGRRGVGRVHSEDEVFAALFLGEDVEGGGGVGWGDNTVGDFAGDDLGGGFVDFVGEGNEVAEGGHAVGAASAGVGLGKARGLDASDVVDLLLLA